ncbi:nucleotide exchange factor GrpE [Methanosarcina thermophila MST-A1]|jgi:molecular chaperone GrpE|uniref:Protein GrpE n=3 Tax=Methanosarcina thermophila TaxID=2210 RepID=A0A0E3NDZ1_METTE|nr:nucleotide exchange factor GrpE [Methanosarcina thermophila]AKB11981.1 Heat shock protein GrpE [Methanosarcina thermophila TM-1]AKB14827.1 Heat shock protein GrpE [Methanosarcina thermophila CHTI-55]NLU58143.1 nucleotide exchange factor GrpE [Methanosarcina thermophila]BAW29624.1 heat shock protein GrpE [Methanosarcina thermophila]GLI14122.1 nucleotide exchange factor GrpE [Methanosarcina thermophila MST-A1]
MKIFDKEGNADSKEDTQAEAGDPDAKNSGSSGGEAKKTQDNPEEAKEAQGSPEEAKEAQGGPEEAKETQAKEAQGSPEEASASSETEKSPEELCREENEILKDQLLRLAADFDNFRKRTARQIEETRKAVLEQVLLDFLEVTDNFDRAIKSTKTAEDMSSIASGLEQLSKQFFSILEKYGIEKIESERASEFDPHKHEAVQHVETSELPDNTIVEVYKAGYALNSKVIRPAIVSVARNPNETKE